MTTFKIRFIWGLMPAFALAAAGAQPPQNAGNFDPAVEAVQPSSSLSANATQAFPLTTFSAFGTSLAQTGHFAELGWSEEQFNAFLDGMRAARSEEHTSELQSPCNLVCRLLLEK